MDLTNHFLVSTGNLTESLFDHSIIYICRHDKDGAFGLVINKPSRTTVRELLDSLKVNVDKINKNMVLHGGPVKTEQVFIMHTPPTHYDVTIKVSDDIGITLSRDILTAIEKKQAPEKIQFAFGYAGWEAGQIECEIKSNAWITLPASPDILFDTPASARLSEAENRHRRRQLNHGRRPPAGDR